MILHTVTALAFLYFIFRIVIPLRCGFFMRALFTLIFLLVLAKFQIFLCLFGTISSPEVPRTPLLVWSWAHAVCMIFVGTMILKDLSAILLRLLKLLFDKHFSRIAKIFSLPGLSNANKQHTEKATSRLSTLALFLFSCILAVWGEWEACRVPDIRRITIPIQALPEKLEGFRIVQLSDLHIGALMKRDWLNEVVERSNSLQPDMIVLTGDLADGKAEARSADIAPLSRLKAPNGVWGCVGNHEYYSDWSGWHDALPKLGIRMLENNHAVLNINNEEIVIAGITDNAALRFSDLKLQTPDIEAAIFNVPPNALKILLAHRPVHFTDAKRLGIQLQLSGHTHGGQILGLQTVVALFNKGLVEGHYTDGKSELYVSAGTGLWPGFPIRIGVPSEITEIILQRK